MLVVGIDPGSVFTGFAWIRGTDHHVQFGGYKSYLSGWWKNTDRVPYRWCRMRDRLETHLKQLPEPPAIVVVEEPSRERCRKPDDRKSLATFMGAYAIAIAEASRMCRDTVIVPVRYMTWTGGLSKEDVVAQLAAKYPPRGPRRDDEADAVGLADFAWGIATSNRKKLLCLKASSSPSSGPPNGSVIPENGHASGS